MLYTTISINIGTPLYSGDFNETVKKAVREAEIYAENGIVT